MNRSNELVKKVHPQKILVGAALAILATIITIALSGSFLWGAVTFFVTGYLAIVFEHPLKLDKTVPALLMGGGIWALISLGHLDVGYIHDGHFANAPLKDTLLHILGKTAEILVFLIGAMTIVELVDLHKGFSVITNKINTTKKVKLLWIIILLAFFMSATLDNLASTIVLVTLLRKLVPNKVERIWFVCMAVIAANSGGAWSPIGDVTTTMLWIGEKVSTMGLITHVVLPSIVCAVIPGVVASFLKPFQGDIQLDHTKDTEELAEANQLLLSSKAMLFWGIGGLIFVPIFKSITHLPPYVGMMIALGVVWLVSEYIHPEEDFSHDDKKKYSAHRALSRIEISAILFFLGILMAVGGLESIQYMYDGHATGLLAALAQWSEQYISDTTLIFILGFGSAIIDNVPLVAAGMGMFDYSIDNVLWHFLAYSAGTGGSMLIIGSAAGVAAMTMERIDFIWYLKNFGWLAFLGFLGGSLFFIL